jgi:hypothetical protein
LKQENNAYQITIEKKQLPFFENTATVNTTYLLGSYIEKECE